MSALHFGFDLLASVWITQALWFLYNWAMFARDLASLSPARREVGMDDRFYGES